MEMPMGVFRGRQVETMTTAYLLWLTSRDAIRYARWPLVEEALRVLRDRFRNLDAVLTELKMAGPPPARWRTPEQEAQRADVRIKKLRRLEEQRAEEKKLKNEQFRQHLAQLQEERLARSQLVDAAVFVREAREAERRAAAAPAAYSDLI